jgi:hypothetical protein
MSIVIIQGHKGSRPARNARQLQQHYRCKRIVFNWTPKIRLRIGDLAISKGPVAVTPGNSVLIEFAAASRAAGLAQ